VSTKPSRPARKELEAAVRADRERQYGDATTGHTNLGLAWTGLLQNHYGIVLDHPLPAHLVLLMMSASKANRAARGLMHIEDNYVDGAIYFNLAGEAALKAEEARDA